jgi:hypothetical protein
MNQKLLKARGAQNRTRLTPGRKVSPDDLERWTGTGHAFGRSRKIRGEYSASTRQVPT